MTDLRSDHRAKTYYFRLVKLHNGKEKFVRTLRCSCVGKAELVDGKWTEGQRGPRGGVCGACNGAIPTDEDR